MIKPDMTVHSPATASASYLWPAAKVLPYTEQSRDELYNDRIIEASGL